MARADHADRPVPAASNGPLSRFEGLCLYRRTCECGESLQLAVLGMERVQGRLHGDPAVREIADHLAQAERHVEIARRLASRWSS